jgi:hypothetical protein
MAADGQSAKGEKKSEEDRVLKLEPGAWTTMLEENLRGRYEQQACLATLGPRVSNSSSRTEVWW